MFSRTNNVRQTVATIANASGFKADADAVNALRVTTTGGKISIFLNGQPVKAIRAQIPDGALRFGMHAEVGKAVDNMPPILVKSYNVTSGQ